VKLSVIIPCYNAAATIGAQLDALAEQRWSEPWEIIIADNRSTDTSMDIVAQYRERLPNLRVIDASEQRGPAYAVNRGIDAALGESVLLCDADDVIGPGYIAAMGAALAEHDFVACAIDDTLLNPSWIRKTRGNYQREGIQRYDYPPYLPHAGGGTLGVKRALHHAIGGFDETLLHLQDTDYCWRLQLAGIKLHFVPGTVMHVRYRSSFSSIYRQARNYAEYNVLLYKRYRRRGMPALAWRSSMDGWLALVRRAPRIRDKATLGAWIWKLGWRMGRLHGSIKHRVLAL